MDEKISVVEYFKKHGADETGNRCGYCRQSNTGHSQGMWGHKVSCQDYQDLIDRGWRRSGKYLYKPTMKKTCCPLYTIRCDATNFQPSKSHKKVIKSMTKFLTDKPKAEDQSSKTTTTTTDGSAASCSSNDVAKEPDLVEKTPKEGTKPEKTAVAGPDPNKPRCKKAKLLRQEKKNQKLASNGTEVPQPTKAKQQHAKSLEEHLAAHLDNPQSTHKLERILVKCDANSPEFQTTFRQSFELFCKYQKEVHKDKPEKLNERRIKLVKVDMKNEDFVDTLRQSHSVFTKYQMNVHGDSSFECGFSQFKGFLVDSPLIFEMNAASPSTGWGSFHEQFYIDGKLIAVGVLDILPYSVSSVYFFYDPEYSFLSLGVYSALRELQFIRELNKTTSQLQYYYLGFYVHSCPKMNYKGNYSPSFLACPETYSWIPIEKCLPKLDIAKYSRLDETDKDDPVVDINTALIRTRRGFMTYGMYRLSHGSSDDDEVREYGQLVGPKVAPRMALYRS